MRRMGKTIATAGHELLSGERWVIKRMARLGRGTIDMADAIIKMASGGMDMAKSMTRAGRTTATIGEVRTEIDLLVAGGSANKRGGMAIVAMTRRNRSGWRILL